MGSHQDVDHGARKEFLRELTMRAEIMEDLGKNELQQGRPLEESEFGGVRVQRRQDDKQDICRISIGGGDHLPAHGDYCNFRGDHARCVALMERALEAMKRHG